MPLGQERQAQTLALSIELLAALLMQGPAGLMLLTLAVAIGVAGVGLLHAQLLVLQQRQALGVAAQLPVATHLEQRLFLGLGGLGPLIRLTMAAGFRLAATGMKPGGSQGRAGDQHHPLPTLNSGHQCKDS